MNIYIMVDIEGISGIYTKEQITPDRSRFDEGRRFMTREVNLCAAACKEMGVDKVYVRDAHGGSYSLIWDELSGDIDAVISGWTGTKRFVGIEDCDAAILLGYHPMAGATDSLLAHTMMFHAYRRFYMNGVPVGETALDSSILAEYQTPVIMVSGSRDACREAKEYLPWVTAVEVKQDAGAQGAVLLSPAVSAQRIRDGVKTAITAFRAGKCDVPVVKKPVTMRLECLPDYPLPSTDNKPYMTVVNEHTFEVTGDTVEETLFRVF